jgi:2-polyprenyl-3-methyl-5-hydroxy-6-metoxy-1,4-benzoquinol methylase
MLKKELESVYRRHHEQRGRYGYLFCSGARSRYLHSWLGNGKKILDLGCRDGLLTKSFIQGNQVTGVDIDRKALEMAGKLGIETRWVDLNAEWPFGKEEFDAIVACEILEHIFFLQPMLEKIHRSLKPNGIFVGSVPNAFRFRNRLKFLKGQEFETDPTHVRMFSYESLRASLSEFFDVEEILPIQGKVFPGISVSEKMPQWMKNLFGRDLLWRSRRIEI